MKYSISAFSFALIVSSVTLTGCVHDQSMSSQAVTSLNTMDSPVGIWLVTGSMMDDTRVSGKQIATSAKGRELVVIEKQGKGLYRLHECALDAEVNYPLISLSYSKGKLQGAHSYTEHVAARSYSEAAKIELTIDGDELHGLIESYDHDLDGRYNGQQRGYLAGTRISQASSIDMLSKKEINQALGDGINRSAKSAGLGITCLGVTSITTTGDARSQVLVSAEVMSVLTPEPDTQLPVSAVIAAE